MKNSRREFIKGVAMSSIVAFSGESVAEDLPRVKSLPSSAKGKEEYHAFSRVFQFMKDPYKTADFLKSCGYDGVEWTVRPGGFVEPEKATLAEFRKLKDAANKAGLKAENVVVGFLRGDDAGAERMMMNAAEAGFISFRGEYFRYNRQKPHRENMRVFRSGFDSLVALAKKSGMKACYQNHSTYDKEIPLFGSLVWELLPVIKDYDPKYLGIQYDPMHIRAEGGPSWDHTLGAVAPWIDIVCLKDFHFILDKENTKDWKRWLDPAGEGIVDFKEVKRLMKLEGVLPRYTVHYDYDFPEEEVGARAFATSDLAYYRSIMG